MKEFLKRDKFETELGRQMYDELKAIKDDPEWMQAIEKQAKERGITIDESLFQNAEYVVQTEKTKQEQIN